jgi:NTP pyrophosphatase (non-canonical NTP hydrolase)
MSSLINDRATEALVILSEECCEVGQIVAKIHRWGLGSTNQGALKTTNRDELIKEMGDVLAMIRIVQGELNISDNDLAIASQNKLEKLKIYSNLMSDK